jgi:hypothetical protein
MSMYILIGIVAIIGFFIIQVITKMNSPEKNGPIARFLLGHHMDGQRRTNATFFKRGNKVLHVTDRASKYAHLSHLEIALMRWISTLFLGALTFGLIVSRMLTIISLSTMCIILIAINAKRIERKYEARWITRGTVAPLGIALAQQWGTTPQLAQRSISINKDYASAKSMDKIGTIVLPDWFQHSSFEQEAFRNLINARLGVELTFKFHTDKHPMFVDVFRAPIPPTLVPFADMRNAMEELSADKVLLGVTGKGEHKVWDMAGEDPMLCVQANTRRGKTRLLLLIICQLLHQGAETVIALDPKRVGLANVLNGVPGVEVYDDPRHGMDDMFTAVRKFREMMDDRYDALKADPTIVFKRAVLAIDEISFLSAMVKRHWDMNKVKKMKNPFWDDLSIILFMGAQAKCSVIIFGQRLDAGIMAGLLESFGTRLMAGFTRNAYNRLIGVGTYPVPHRQRGRFLFYDGDTPVWIQTILGDDIELRDWAMHGRRIETPTVQEILDVEESRHG